MREEKTNPIQLLERDIIMLPTNGKSPIGLAKDCVWFDDNTLLVQDDKFELIVQAFKEDLISYQHLYVLSDDEIKEGDWVYNKLSGIGKCIYINHKELDFTVEYNNGYGEVSEIMESCKKIIATTAYLPKPGAGTFNSLACLPVLNKEFLSEYALKYNNKEDVSVCKVLYELLQSCSMMPDNCCGNPGSDDCNGYAITNYKLELINFTTPIVTFKDTEYIRWYESSSSMGFQHDNKFECITSKNSRIERFDLPNKYGYKFFLNEEEYKLIQKELGEYQWRFYKGTIVHFYGGNYIYAEAGREFFYDVEKWLNIKIIW